MRGERRKVVPVARHCGLHGSLLIFAVVSCFWRASFAAFVSTQAMKRLAVTTYADRIVYGRKLELCSTIQTRMSEKQKRNNALIYPLHALTSRDSSGLKDTADTKPSFPEQQQQQQQNSTHQELKNTKTAINEQKTLYELLQVSPTATREQIKQSYIKMAKLTHPDAMRSGGGEEVIDVNFSEIASAYKLLSDPKQRKRYDRSLVAEHVKREIEKAAMEVGNAAGPQLLAVLRRTTATTNAVIASAVKDLQHQSTVTAIPGRKSTTLDTSSDVSKNPLDFAKVLNSAIKAGQDASRAIDRLELIEKSRDLEKRARKELIQSKVLRSKATEMAEQRLFVTLRTPNSAMTSSDATRILERLNVTEQSLSLIDSVLAKRSLQDHVQRLEAMETDYNGRMNETNAIEMDYRKAKAAFERSEKSLSDAIEVGVLDVNDPPSCYYW